nr:hypothetical protein [Aquirufa ecclesiirivi]
MKYDKKSYFTPINQYVIDFSLKKLKPDSGFKIPDKPSKFFFSMASDFPSDVFSVFFDGKLGEVEFFGNFL